MQVYVALVVGLLVVCGLAVISLYNGLVRRRNAVENVEGSLDALLKKRYDLIPNLVACVQPYVQHEKALLETLTELRVRGTAGKVGTGEHVAVDPELTAGLQRLVAVSEGYPQLKASEVFLQLQGQLADVEGQLAAARRTYNSVVTAYNDGIETFPSNLIASAMGMTHRSVFHISEQQRGDVKVKDLFRAA